MVKREEVENAVAFANIKNKIRYNTKYKDISLKVRNKAFLVLYRGYQVVRGLGEVGLNMSKF